MPPKRVQRATLTSQTEAAIRADIIGGGLAPGQRLSVTDLSEHYGVSATPLREALQRLAADSLVEIDPRLGATVAPISRTDLRDTYRIREILESLALEDAIDHGNEQWEKDIKAAFQEFEAAVAQSELDESGPTAWSRAHRAFHDALLASSESNWLKTLLGVLNDHTERYRMISAQSGVRHPIAEHHSILEAALNRDKAAAVDALRRHLELTVEVIESSLSGAESEPAGNAWWISR